MRKILITGVAGFIGSNLASYLINLNKYKVIGIDNLSYGLIEQIPKKVKFYHEDIRSKKLSKIFKDVDTVFHLAAKNCISDCQANPVETYDINVHGSVNIFQYAKENKVKKIIYADSSAVYEGIKHFPSKENITAPLSYYALSKKSASDFLNGFANLNKIHAVALRYFNVYGVNQDYRRSIPPLMSSLIIKLLTKKKPIIYGDGRKKRDFIHVDDINDFHHILIEKNMRKNYEVFNLGSGVNYSVNEIFLKIKDLLNLSVNPVYKKDLPGEAEENLADIKLAKQLNWSPKIKIDEGISEMIQHIKKNVIER